MAVNLIVAAITLWMLGFAMLWVLRPGLRPWIEMPKYQVLAWDRKDEEGTSDEESVGSG